MLWWPSILVWWSPHGRTYIIESPYDKLRSHKILLLKSNTILSIVCQTCWYAFRLNILIGTGITSSKLQNGFWYYVVYFRIGSTISALYYTERINNINGFQYVLCLKMIAILSTTRFWLHRLSDSPQLSTNCRTNMFMIKLVHSLTRVLDRRTSGSVSARGVWNGMAGCGKK